MTFLKKLNQRLQMKYKAIQSKESSIPTKNEFPISCNDPDPPNIKQFSHLPLTTPRHPSGS
jgi:hypothetical protein